jgi:DNA-directed RNA polymerase subunit RPC12/RpoP
VKRTCDVFGNYDCPTRARALKTRRHQETVLDSGTVVYRAAPAVGLMGNRRMRTHDAYSLECVRCKRQIEVPVASVRDGRLRCPYCDHVHVVD